MAQAVFLSYSSDDAETARRICDALRAAGLEVWFDQSELRGGDAWDASIRKQIKECALFVPIISPNTQSREEGYFRLEWKLAVDRSHLMADDKAFLFPVVLGDVAEPAARVPDRFRERQWTRVSDDASMRAFAERMATVQADTGTSAHPDRPPEGVNHATGSRLAPDATTKPPASRRYLVITAAALVALGITLVAWAPWNKPGTAERAGATKEAPLDPQLVRARDLIDSIGAVAPDVALAGELVKGVLNTRPTDPDAVILMCRVHVYALQRGFDRTESRFASAKEFAEKAMNLAPENPVAKVCMADYLYRRRLDSERALKLVEEAIAAQPQEPRYHRLRNGIRSSLSRFSRAEQLQFAAATAEQFPQDAIAQHNAGLHFLGDAKFPEAKSFLRRAISIGPQMSSAPTLAAIEMWFDGDLAAARSTIDAVSEKQRSATRTIIVQFEFAMLSGDTAFGLGAVRAHPDPWMKDFAYTGPTALLNGELLLRDSKPALAKPYFEQAYAEWTKHKQELMTDNRNAWLEPYLLWRLGKAAEARARYAVAFSTVSRPYRPVHLSGDMWLFQPIAITLLVGERKDALQLMREAAESPAPKQIMRNAMRLDPRMSPFRNDAEFVKILAD